MMTESKKSLSRRQFLASTATVAAVTGMPPMAAAAIAQSRGDGENKSLPNIVLITCHDLGQHLNCYGVKTVSSPSVDALAKEGVLFRNSFCTAPQCSPSRASIYTGAYPHNNGVMGLVHGRFGFDIDPAYQHLCGMLQWHGYTTALVGIQHERTDTSTIGFDKVLSLGRRYPCDQVEQDAMAYLNEAKSLDQPFYLQIGFYEPHRPFDFGGATPDDTLGVTIPPFLKDEPSARREMAEFQGIIKKVDASIGRIIDRLDEKGLADNTIVIFTSDHGVPFPRAKCSLYDPGIEVPFIIRWPKRGWVGGRVCEEMILNIDYVPTLLDAIEKPIPVQVQGKSFCALLDNKSYTPRDHIFAEMTYHNYYDPCRAIRTDRYKLAAFFSTAPSFMEPSQSFRPATITIKPADPTRSYHHYIELYDLKDDPLEWNNLADSADHEAIRNELCRKLYHWMVSTNDVLVSGSCIRNPHHNVTLEILRQA